MSRVKNIVKTMLAVALFSVCSGSFASEYDRTFYTYSDEANTVKVAKVVQTLHQSNGIWFLKQHFSYVNGGGPDFYGYKCFNGYPYNPLTNLSQSWLSTDSKLSRCERAKQELMKNGS